MSPVFWFWPGAWNHGLRYRIIYIIMVVVIKGKLTLDIGPTHLVAAASLVRGRAPWRATGCRWPSGAMSGISQAFLLIALFA